MVIGKRVVDVEVIIFKDGRETIEIDGTIVASFTGAFVGYQYFIWVWVLLFHRAI
jgi:hypothetical protein